MSRMLSIRTLAPTLCLALIAPSIHAQSGPRAGDTIVAIADLSPNQGPLSKLLKAEYTKAARAGRTPFVEIGAEWCSQCRELKASLGDKRMIDAFAKTYIIRLDLDAWNGELPALGFNASAVPMFFALDSNGRATGVRFTTDPLGANTPDHVAEPLQKFFREHLRKDTP